MAILIPSKHIYGDIENPKVRNNLIDKVSIEQKIVETKIETDVNVANVKSSNFNISSSSRPSIKNLTNDTSNSLDSYRKIRNATESKISVSNSSYSITIPKQNTISTIITLLNNSKVSALTTFKKTVYPYKTTYKPRTNAFDYSASVTDEPINEETSSGLSYNFEVSESNIDTQSKADIRNFSCSITDEKITAKIYTSFFELGYGGGAITNDTENIFNFTDFSVYSTDNGDNFSVNIEGVPTRIDITLLYSKPMQSSSQSPDSDSWLDKNYTASGYKIIFEPIYIEFSFNGNTWGVSLDDGTITCGSGNNPYTINGSELVQNNPSFAQSMAEKIISEYSKGKETATIRCDIGEYYFYNKTNPQVEGKKVISASDEGLSMTFNEGDIVIPMIPSASGGDEPMSRYQDGTAKEFRVVGTPIINDGAVWQKIYLQEM